MSTTSIPQHSSVKNQKDRVKFAEDIKLSDESDIFPYKCGQLYIRKAKGEVLELDHVLH